LRINTQHSPKKGVSSAPHRSPHPEIHTRTLNLPGQPLIQQEQEKEYTTNSTPDLGSLTNIDDTIFVITKGIIKEKSF
jgi:hypothetical protein